MRLLSIAFVASWLAQNVAAEIPNKYLSVGLLSVVCQNDAKNADEDFYVFSKEGDGWISIVGNVTNIHEGDLQHQQEHIRSRKSKKNSNEG